MSDKPDFVPQQVAAEAPRTDVVFPAIARLELDELLTELIGRAQDVLESQGRLRALLSATRAVSEDLSLPMVLRRIVDSACQLVGARYGALGVVSESGGLEQFIQSGIDDDEVARIGHLPTGRGILGQLIVDPRPLRLDNINGHQESVGFPDNHPPMRTFLGVPVRVRDRVFGNIYLTEKSGGRAFTDDDEELLVALAGAAAIAIDHAQLFADAQARRDAHAAAADVTRSLREDHPNPLALIAQHARQVADADLAVVVGVDAAGRSRVTAADGAGASAVRGMIVQDTAVEAVADALKSHGVDAANLLDMSVIDSSGQVALLLVTRPQSADHFSTAERDAVKLFGDQATAALAQLASQRNARLVELLRQRDAIAREMNDQVVSRLFAAGLALQGIASRIPDDELRARLADETNRLDGIITTIRTSIFAAEPAPPGA